MKALLIAHLLLFSGAARAEDRFDLSCEGPRSLNGVERGRSTILLRIDLGARRYCIADCKEVWQISPVSAERVDFRDHVVGTKGSAAEATSKSHFDRVSSRYHSTKVMNYTLTKGSPRRTITSVEDLTCVAGPFSGFPAAS
ncbi:MAG TPA: hypothetical protein VK472_00635 [Allosphingosinicella sp.]|nr:hypothetical protein [Allosphingosinicella sp.]